MRGPLSRDMPYARAVITTGACYRLRRSTSPADRPVARGERRPQRMTVPRCHLGEYRRIHGQQAECSSGERSAEAASARSGLDFEGDLPAPGQPSAQYQAASPVTGLPGAYLIAVAMCTAYSRMGIVRELVEIEPCAMAVGPGTEYRIT